MSQAWISISKTLPSDLLIVEWLYKDGGTERGSIIGGLNNSLWVLPDDGRSPEIHLEEFTHWRKLPPKSE